ncbi:D-2-hydroxyacid dehydrogenase [Brevibacterium sp. p3-SID960]|uniref:D-2-hydroxyacid dehydrogenase n=1 Tax=Brevibacterium sp. p3-SID960 TaxID=2916063 RepID=UPI0021A6F6FB|nr:D-2-hydroxyacid dehydrogenase [Brevibacterium sp. p3-SID960]MCT1689701.1 D-2-hydroxyacid dehydrogenase [Brevibacterium sp. p3-SID960]
MTVLTILTAPDKKRPAHFDRLADEASEVRWVEADELAAALPGTEVLLMWDFFSPALEDAFGAADRLRWIHAASAGVDSLMFDQLRDSAVTVTNARGTFDRPIAEFVLAFMLHFAKDFPASLAHQRQRIWQHRESRDLAGSHAMIVGTGSIGRAIAVALRALGVHVSGAGSRARGGDPDFGEIIASADLAAHVSDVDWLINIAPLTAQTTGLIDAAVLQALPASAHLINVGRGASVVTGDLVAALQSGQIAGAGLDVVDPEPLPEGSPLWQMGNVVITPHMSGDSAGWSDRLAEQFMANWDRYRAGEQLFNIVDKAKGYAAG